MGACVERWSCIAAQVVEGCTELVEHTELRLEGVCAAINGLRRQLLLDLLLLVLLGLVVEIDYWRAVGVV